MKKRSICIFGHYTSLNLEDEFFLALKKIALRENKSVAKLISEIDEVRGKQNLSSAVRVFVLNYINKLTVL